MFKNSKRWTYIENSDGAITHICDLSQRNMYALDTHEDVLALIERLSALDKLNDEYYEMIKSPVQETPKKLKLFEVMNKKFQSWITVWAYDTNDAYEGYLKREGFTHEAARSTNYRLSSDYVVVTECVPIYGKRVSSGGW